MSNQPLYNIHKTFLENLNDGPEFDGPIPSRTIATPDQWINFLDHKVMSPIGAAACAVTMSKGIALLAQLGFDVLTYKTIRCAPFPAHPLPNIVFVDATTTDCHQPVYATKTPNLDDIALANSFGNAGPGLGHGAEFFYNDIKIAKASLLPGQILIVSVYGTGKTVRELAQDFVAAAQVAAQAGADAIEVNLSCPNIGDGKKLMYQDHEMVQMLIKNIADAVKIPVIAKVGIFTSQESLKEILLAIARAGGRGICGINSIPMPVLNADGTPAFGSETRKISGVCGAPLRNFAVDFVTAARKIIDEEKLALTVSGVGGVTKPEHFAELLNAGADVALSASGMMFNPYLAHEFHTCGRGASCCVGGKLTASPTDERTKAKQSVIRR